ncbi:hypothetical protein K3495_g2120 [Podosphaera aphanis]|nr:hypothetical protein K3495_g2120 [Podosphaera aphanis]
MDEHGIALGFCANSMVLASSGKKRTYVKSPQSREWVSIIETISASGQPIGPLIIFKGSNLQSTWGPDNSPDWQYTTSENGSTCINIAINWLKHMFIPETNPVDGGHRILLMDRHESHTTTEFLWICKQNNAELLFLPSHSIHVLQYLDLGVFAPLES